MSKNTCNTVDSHGNGKNSETTKALNKGSKYDANLRKRGFLRFQIGLILSMVLVYLVLGALAKAMQSEAYVKYEPTEELVEYYADAVNYTIEAPKEKRQVPQKVKSPVFEIVPDDALTNGLDEFIEKLEQAEGDKGLTVGEVDYEEPDVDLIVPWVVVEDVPVFPGCEKVAKSDRKACFQEKMKKHIMRNFRYPNAEQELGIQGRVNVMFKIDTDGSIIDVQMRGPNKNLEKEAARIIRKLPKMTPGKQRGKAVKVPFSVPIIFKLN